MTSEQPAPREVHVLWHARHLAMEDDGRIVHQDPDGSLHLDEEEWRILGVWTTEAAAEARRQASKGLPGFSGEPDCFDISSMTLDEDLWNHGYFTEWPDGTQED